jgi:hypothetical protein
MLRQTALIVTCAMLAACGGGGGSSMTPASGSAQLSIAMTDGQLQLNGITVTAVNLGIDKVEVVGNGNQPTVVQSFSSPDVVNILNYTSQSSQLTFTGSIPAGSYQQIRLVLDTATTTISYTQNGQQYTNVPLFVPSATSQQFGNGTTSTDNGDGQGTAGVKINVGLQAQSGGSYGFVLDFNAGQSIVQTGSGSFTMKPVIVATAQSMAGAIAGTVQNQAGAAVSGAEVEAMQNGTVVNAAITSSTGAFTINALPAGTYTLVVQNVYITAAGTQQTASGYDSSVGNSLTVPGTVTVTAGSTTTLSSPITD